MADIILHQYPQSPVAEKVRVGLGIKHLYWRSVEIPRIPPKPDLIPLTGGYRRTPVMQIGADVYCDSQCILRELERRFPQPGYFPAQGGGLSWGLSRWTDDRFFGETIKLVLAGQGDNLPADFAEDRGRLYMGPDWQQALLQARSELAHLSSQIRGQLAWVNDWLGACEFMTGSHAGVADACVYYLVWFVRGRYDGGAQLLSEFPNLLDWEQRVAAIGHGSSEALSAEAALAIARESEVETLQLHDKNDPQQLVPGMAVSVKPDVNAGEMAVDGIVHAVSSDTISLLRESEQTGQVCVHFPRVGYRVDVQ
ncbi:hypothetical protein AB833_04115 [Chromatiales bacterium (ex Bugula neritina AB1)]|nr:hypothetical protein AB833_04115 [Chromatiales bacterium (ex Bugula neritina AB1)]